MGETTKSRAAPRRAITKKRVRMLTERPSDVPPLASGGPTAAPPAFHDVHDGVPDASEPLADLGPASRETVGARAAAPSIDWREERRATLPGNRYVRVL